MAEDQGLIVAGVAAAADLIEAKVSLTKEDVVATYVSDAEERLTSLLRDAQVKLEELHARNRRLKEARDEMVKEEVRSIVATHGEKMQTALGAICILKVHEPEYTRSPNWENLKVTVAVESKNNEDEDETAQGFRLSATLTFSHKPSDGVLQLCKDIEATAKQVDEVNNEAIKLKKAMTQIPRLERRARAAITKYQMESSAKGQELLTKLRTALDKDLAQLG